MARRGAEFWRGQLEAWHRSDLTQRDYCARHGLSEKSFYRWRGKEKAARCGGSIVADAGSGQCQPAGHGRHRATA
jgi:hypothetical protein